MDIYLVGGAVRDELLGLPVHERDWVVVGGTSDDLLAQGFKSVGSDFPVFLHPETGEEYALARTERKTGQGHRGFECDSSAGVTLEEDLQRRDFTINAIAKDRDGNLIDPWGGVSDLEARRLRHISPAFEEDPLRVIRAARFLARFHHLGFRIDAATLDLLRRMVRRGDLEELPPERIVAEMEKSLVTANPEIFFEQLRDIGAANVLWPEITQQGTRSLARLAQISDDPVARFTALVADLEPDRVATLARRMKIAGRYAEPARLVCQYYGQWTNVFKMDASSIVDLLYGIDAIRRPDRFSRICGICRLLDSADGEEMAQRKQDIWERCLDAAASVRAVDIAENLRGPELGMAIRERQIELVEQAANS